MSRNAPPVDSPCSGVCRMDERNGLCLGCQRTLGEIATWSSMSESQKRAVVAALPARRHGANPPPQPLEASPP